MNVCHSSGGHPTITVLFCVGAGVAMSRASSLRMARPEAKCSCCTLAWFPYQSEPISDIPFCKRSMQTTSRGNMENAWFNACSAADSLKSVQARIHFARRELRFVSASGEDASVVNVVETESASGSEPEASFSFHRPTAREIERPSACRFINHLMLSISYCEYRR